MSAPGYQISRDPTAVIGARSAAWIVDFLLFILLAFALGPSPLSPLAEYTEVPDGMNMEDACERVRDLEDVSGCVVIGDRVYFTDASDALIQSLASLLLFVLVFVVWQGATGLTPGKLLVGLRTVGQDGRPPGPLKAFVRSLLWIIDGLPCIPLVGFITALTSTGHRRVGDMAAKTFVVAKADMGQPVMVPGLTSGTYGTPTAYPGQPGYGTPMPGSTPWGTPPASPGGPAAPGAPSWGTPPSAPSAPGSPYPAADTRPGPPTSPYGTPATPGTPSGGYGAPAPAPAADVTGPTAPAPPPAPDAGSFGESGDPSDADRPATHAAPSADAGRSDPAEKVDQSEKDREADEAREDASPSASSEAPAASSEPASPAASTESAAAPTADAPAPSAGSDATVEQTYSPQWDAARGAYIQWDPNRSRWLQWDDTAKEWKPI